MSPRQKALTAAVREEAIANHDAPKKTWDLIGIDTPDKLRTFLEQAGSTVEAFKQLPVYKANVDKMPWLREL